MRESGGRFSAIDGWRPNCIIAAIFSDLVFGFHVGKACGQCRAASYWGSGGLRGVCAVTALVRAGLGRSGRAAVLAEKRIVPNE